jgi:hypothetical protein
MYGRVQALATIPGAMEYLMVARGVFPEGTKQRPQPMEPEARQAARGAAGGGRGSTVLTDKEKEAIHYALDVYLKPSLRA